MDIILESLAAEILPPADPRVLELLAAAGQPELVAVYARTRTPAPPRPATDIPAAAATMATPPRAETPRLDADVSNEH